MRLRILHKNSNGKYHYCGVLRAMRCISPCSYSQNLLGVPFNISSYALPIHMIAHVCGLEPGEFVYTLGDYHIYQNHLEQVEQVLARDPLPLPQLEIVDEGERLRGLDGLLEMRYSNLKLNGYHSHGKISAAVAV